MLQRHLILVFGGIKGQIRGSVVTLSVELARRGSSAHLLSLRLLLLPLVARAASAAHGARRRALPAGLLQCSRCCWLHLRCPRLAGVRCGVRPGDAGVVVRAAAGLPDGVAVQGTSRWETVCKQPLLASQKLCSSLSRTPSGCRRRATRCMSSASSSRQQEREAEKCSVAVAAPRPGSMTEARATHVQPEACFNERSACTSKLMVRSLSVIFCRSRTCRSSRTQRAQLIAHPALAKSQCAPSPTLHARGSAALRADSSSVKLSNEHAPVTLGLESVSLCCLLMPCVRRSAARLKLPLHTWQQFLVACVWK